MSQDDFLRHITEEAVEAAAAARGRQQQPNGYSRGRGAEIELVHFADMRPRLGGRPLVKGILEHEQTSLVVGPTQSGKTFLALDFSLHIACGLEWFGRRVDGGAVVYVAAEAGRSIINRVAAWKLDRGYSDEAAIDFAAVTSPVDLCHADKGDIDRLIAAIEGASFDRVVLVVVDTVSRALAGGDENSPGDMGALVRSLDRLRDELHCHVSAVHHHGKEIARGARGHSLLTANLDTVIKIVRDEASRISAATLTKQRDGATGSQIAFKLRPVELGRDADGDPVTSCVVIPADAAPGTTSKKTAKLSAAQSRALALLADAIDRGGEIPPANGHIPANIRCVEESLWREYCDRGAISSGGKDAQQKAFKRAAEALLAAGRVGKWEPWVWLA